MFCKTEHNRLTDDFIISDGCYQHRQFTQAETCSSHGFCNHDTTCHCVCGYTVNNCSVVHVAKVGYPSKNRYFSGAPLNVNITNNATGGRVALVRQQVPGVTSCVGAGASPLNSYAASF